MSSINLSLRSFLASLSDASYACAALGRLLISSIGILLPLMLWTEHTTTFDRFFQGGQDCEMSLLALLAFLCMVILLGLRSRQSMVLWLAVLRFSALVLQLRRRNFTSHLGRFNFLRSDNFSLSPAVVPLPLRI